MLNISCNVLNTVLEVKTGMAGYRIAVSVLGDHSRGRVADWELRLALAAQHHERGPYSISLAQEKVQMYNSKYSFY